jgi:hypothetical protein
MEISNYNIEELIKDKEKLSEYIKKHEDIKNNLKEDQIKVSLLNIDSNYRNTQPKNINETNTVFLPDNPIITKKGSNLLKFNYPNHNLNIGDFVTITNIESINKTILNSLFMFNSFNYLIIKIIHSVPKDYKSYIDNLEIDIKLLTELDSNVDADTKFYGSIPINMLIGLKKVTTFQDILDENFNMSTNILEKLKSSITPNIDTILQDDYIYNNFLFVKLDFNFISNNNLDLYKINHVYNIRLTSINGIPLNFINADYPINYDKKQGKHEVANIENDYIYIYTKSKAYSAGELGGSKISMFKILKTISGFPNAGEFSINLRNNFTNVVRIELVSSEFTFTDYVIKDGINNKLYWQHLDDGDKIYEIAIPSGNYSAANLIETVSTHLNNVERITSTPENRIYNNFEVILNTFTNRLEIKAFSQTVLPNSITESTVIIDNKQYFQLDIKHPNNFVETTDFITISNSETIGEIPKASINSIHQVYKINKTDQTYSIILLPFNKITSTSGQKGGSSLKIRTTSKVRFLFNKQNTIGEILGFSNPGDIYSVTPFSSVISNTDSYVYPNDLDTVGNKSSISNILQFAGKNNYWLLYLNNFESVILNNGLESCFAKILLAGSQGDIIYNSFVNSPIEFDIPIPTISELNIKITDPQGNIINFENTDFSFTIRVLELISKPRGVAKFSNDTGYHKEMIDMIGRNI